MKKRFIVANWKSNKNVEEAKQWLAEFKSVKVPENKKIVVCASFTLLSEMARYIKENSLSITLGAQNISSFSPGAFTGEVNGQQLKEFVEFTLVGHSERRSGNGETDENLEKKVMQANGSGIEVIYCVGNAHTFIPHPVRIVAYEPTSAISTSGVGVPDTAENANTVALEIKKQSGIQYVLYGGSVKEDNVNGFTTSPDIDGVLVGAASLDAQKFIKIIHNA